jgi:hypothetical protein
MRMREKNESEIKKSSDGVHYGKEVRVNGKSFKVIG